MIKKSEPLTLPEVISLSGDTEKEKAVNDFIKEFVSMKPEKAKELKEKLAGLDIIKLKPRHIVKIIDFMPQDAEDLNKIISDASLNQEEISKVLQTIK